MIDAVKAKLRAELVVVRKQYEQAVVKGRQAQEVVEQMRIHVASLGGSIATYEKLLKEVGQFVDGDELAPVNRLNGKATESPVG